MILGYDLNQQMDVFSATAVGPDVLTVLDDANVLETSLEHNVLQLFPPNK